MNRSLNSIPVIKRARGYHLYDINGNRYLDFFQEGGKALLGHRPHGFSLAMKNIISRGLYSSYPSEYDTRVHKALLELFPDYSGFAVFGCKMDAEEFLSTEFGKNIVYKEIDDPLFVKETGSLSVSYWRPFLDRSFPDCIIPVLPFPGNAAPVVTAFKTGSSKFLNFGVSPYILGALSRQIYNLIAVLHDKWYDELPFHGPQWTAEGPYLFYSGTEEKYRKTFHQGLENGLLLNPDYSSFSIIPADYDSAEIKRFRKEVFHG